jgi:hypothetical protein
MSPYFRYGSVTRRVLGEAGGLQRRTGHADRERDVGRQRADVDGAAAEDLVAEHEVEVVGQALAGHRDTRADSARKPFGRSIFTPPTWL